MKIAIINFNKSKTTFQNKMSFCDKNFDNAIAKRTLELKQRNVAVKDILTVIEFDERTYKKVLYLIDEKIYVPYAIRIAQSEDIKYKRTLELLKLGFSADDIIEIIHLDEKTYQKTIALAKKGIRGKQLTSLTSQNGKYYGNKKIETMINQGICYYSAVNCSSNINYENFLNQGYGAILSAVLTELSKCNKDLDEETIALCAQITRKIIKNSTKSNDFVYDISNFLNKYLWRKEVFKKLNDFVEQIDFNEIKRIAPHMARYSGEELIKFINWHFSNNTEEFNHESLSINNLTKHLEENYLNPNELDELLVAHPLIRREVGNIPKDWFDKVQDESEASAKIYKAINEFQKDKNLESFSEKLTEILNKKAKVEKISQGGVGLTYKIQIEDSEPVCLKLFYLKNKYNYLCHGANFEVQTGLFLNTHSNDFVHMLFGKVSTKYAKDGFLVTQYLDSTKTPIKNDNLQTGYSINYVDDKEENFINGVIIDYGGARINKDFC